MAFLTALLRPPLALPPAPLVQLIATASGAAGGASDRLQLHIRRCYSFNNRAPLANNAPPLRSSLSLEKRSQSAFPLPNLVAKLFGPAIFEASKLDVMFIGGVTEDEHADHIDLPRIYTLTHCDMTAMLTLTISQSINQAQLQGWYKRLQRDDVVAMWRRCQGSMSLHVHCHISDGHWFRDALARLRLHIFKRELPVVLEAFKHGDQALLIKHPELEKAPVWVYFHSNVKEFNKVECWGPLQFAREGITEEFYKQPAQCRIACECCFPRWRPM